MPTKTLTPLPQALRYLQSFVNRLAKLPPEAHRNQDIDASRLDAALRKRIDGLDARSAETALREDRERLDAWLRTAGGRDHPAYWVLGYLMAPRLARELLRPPKPAAPRPPARGPGIELEAPQGWTLKPRPRRLELKTTSAVGSIEILPSSTFDDLLRLQPKPVAGNSRMVVTRTSTIRRGGCSGKKHVAHWKTRLPAKHVQYLLRVPGGHVLIGLSGIGKADFDESPLEAKLNTLRLRRRR
jgi:hypothetical protein